MRKLFAYSLLLALLAFVALAATTQNVEESNLSEISRKVPKRLTHRLGGVKRLWVRRIGRVYDVWSTVCTCRRIHRRVRVNSRFGRRLSVFGTAAKIRVSRGGQLRVRRLVGKRWVVQRRPAGVKVLRVLKRFRPKKNKRLVRVLIKGIQRPRVGAILRSRVTILRRGSRVAVTFVRGQVRRIVTFRYGAPQTKVLEKRFGRIRQGITIRVRGQGTRLRVVRAYKTKVGGRVVTRRVRRVVVVNTQVRAGFRRLNRKIVWRPVIRTGYLWRRVRRRWVCYVRIRRGRRFVYNRFKVVSRLPAPIARIAGKSRSLRVNFGSRGVRIVRRVGGKRVRTLVRYVSPAFRRIVTVTTTIPRKFTKVIKKVVLRKVRKQRVNRRVLVRQVIQKARVTVSRTVRHVVISWTRRVRGIPRAYVCRYRWGGRRAQRVVRLWGAIPARSTVTVKRTGKVWKVTRRVGSRKIVVRRPFVRTQVKILRKVISRKVVATPAQFRIVPGRKSLKWFKPGKRRGQWVFVKKTTAPLPANVRNVCRGVNVRSIRIRLKNGRFGVRCISATGVRGNVVSLPLVPRLVTVIKKVVKKKAPVAVLRVLKQNRGPLTQVCFHRKTIQVRYTRKASSGVRRVSRGASRRAVARGAVRIRQLQRIVVSLRRKGQVKRVRRIQRIIRSIRIARARIIRIRRLRRIIKKLRRTGKGARRIRQLRRVIRRIRISHVRHLRSIRRSRPVRRSSRATPATSSGKRAVSFGWVQAYRGHKYVWAGQGKNRRLVRRRRYTIVRRRVGPLASNQYLKNVDVVIASRKYTNGLRFRVYKVSSRRGRRILRRYAAYINKCVPPSQLKGRRVRRRVVVRKRSPARILRTKRIGFRRVGVFIVGTWRTKTGKGVIRFPVNSKTGQRVQKTFGTIGARKVIVSFFGKRVIVRTKGAPANTIRNIRVSRAVTKTLYTVRRVPARIVERRIKFTVVSTNVILYRRSFRRRRWVVYRRLPVAKATFASGLKKGVINVRKGVVKVSGVNNKGVFRRTVIRAQTGSAVLKRISHPRIVSGSKRRTIVIRRVRGLFITSGYTRRGKPFIYTIRRTTRSPLSRYLLSYWNLRTATKVVIRTPRRGGRVVVTRYIGKRRIGTKRVSRRQVTGLVRFVGRRSTPLTTVSRIRFRTVAGCVVYSRFQKGRWVVFRRLCGARRAFITRRAVGFVRGYIYIRGGQVVVRGRTQTGGFQTVRKKISAKVVGRIRAIVPKAKKIKVTAIRVARHGRTTRVRRHRRGYSLPTSCFRVWRVGNRIFLSRRVRGQCRPVVSSYLRGSRRFSRLLRIAGGRLGRKKRTICRVRGRYIIVGRRGLRGGCPCKARRRRRNF